MRVLAVFAIAFAAALPACSSSDSAPASAPSISERLASIGKLTGNASAGATVFTTTSSPTCVSCHNADGKGSTTVPGLAEPSANDGVTELAGYILNGKGAMSKQPALSDQQVADVIAYMLATFK